MKLGLVRDKVPLWKGIKGLFNPSLSSEEAVRRFSHSCRTRGMWRMINLRDPGHSLIVSPTGGGKGAAFLIPELEVNTNSSVVVDQKGDLFSITSKQRHKMGHQVIRLDPFGITGGVSDRFNPLDGIHRDSATFMDDCRDLATALVVRSPEEREPFWNNSSEQMIACFLMATVQFVKADLKNLQTMRLLLTDPERFKKSIQHMTESDACDGMLAREANKLKFLTGKELSSVMTTTNLHLRPFDTPLIAENTSSSTFDPSQLVKGRMTIYLVLPPDRFDANVGLLRMWISSFIRVVFREGIQ